MFDINTAINTAIAAAVAEATKPLVERIAALETKLAEAALFERTTEVTIPVDEAKMVEALNSQEWFWEKVRRFADGAIDIKIEEAIDEHNERTSHFDEDDIDTKIDNAIDKHEENKTHGDDDDIEEIVQKLLNSASISITV